MRRYVMGVSPVLVSISVLGAVLLALSFTLPAQAAPAYNVSGSWVIAFDYLGTPYAHDMTLAQDGAGNLTGSGGYPAGGPHVYTWVIDSGLVDGNSINFTAHYTATADAVTPLTVMNVTGTIAPNGTMSGTWDDNYQGGTRNGTWTSASGAASSLIPSCSSDNTTFDTFTLGSVNGQFGWSATGPFDQAIVANTYGIASFGCKTLRVSDSVTSGSFGDQIFSYAITNEAGEADALNGGMSGGTRKSHFEAQFDLASALSTLQTGMHISVSPDRGDGARMSYLRFEDQADGIHVFFDDVQGTGNPANFVETAIATITRAPHTIKFVMDFVDGPSNDVVKIYIDGTLVHTGTSWENYYRFDPESNPTLVSNSRTVDSLLFRESGTANVADVGKGFLIDNVSITSGTVVVPPVITVPTTADMCKKDGWKTLYRSDASVFKNQGDCIQYVNTGK